jgi:cytochrome c biogenesis protein CcdA
VSIEVSVSDYYALLSSLANWLNGPIANLGGRVGLPIFTALLLGLLGATSPCQLTTNVSALAYISRRSHQPALAWRSAFAYILGKALVYTLVGVLVILVGLQLQQAAIPAVVLVRKALGPLLVLFGLFLLGVVRFGFVVGQGLSDWLAERAGGQGSRDSFLLGVAFAFAFCPTLFLLFFGVLIPLAVQSRGGLVFPGVFALGTTLPLLLLLVLFGIGLKGAQAKLTKVKRLDLYLRRAAGVVFLIAGLNELVLYWLV